VFIILYKLLSNPSQFPAATIDRRDSGGGATGSAAAYHHQNLKIIKN
jgi:hypothetical protein